jgi:Fe-S cluster biogenesis protein NfuA/nitrite reductase/ring-hydroxylating ferredoxin subunit
MSGDGSPGELLARVEQLSARVEQLADPAARELAQELVGAVIDMYGDGLRRIVEAIAASREAGATILDELAQDGAVASLLLIHDLYPVPLRDRVLEALDTVRPYMESHGGDVELLGVEDGVARLALRGSCQGCAASQATLELAIRQALDEYAPDLAGVEVEGVAQPPTIAGFELPMVHAAAGGGGELPMVDTKPPRWVALSTPAELGPAQLQEIEVEGAALLLANVEGSLLAYRNRCASCGATLHDGELAGPILRCAACGAEFDLRRAGRAAGGEPLQLAPVPLLESGGVRVAV